MIELALLGILLGLLWIGWELHRIANKFDAIQTGLTSVEDSVTTAGTNIANVIDMQAASIKDEIAEIGNKLPD